METLAAIRHPLVWLSLGILGISAVYAGARPTIPPLEDLDPVFMQAVTASVSQHDVKAILAHQHSTVPVDLQLYTSCDEERRCTVFTTMNFPRSGIDSSSISLHVATRVIPERRNAEPTAASSWQVQSIDPAINEHATYAGDFRDLERIPPIGDKQAIAGVLTAIDSAIAKVLGAHGVAARSGSADVIPR